MSLNKTLNLNFNSPAVLPRAPDERMEVTVQQFQLSMFEIFFSGPL
jgi:hypothetical protein